MLVVAEEEVPTDQVVEQDQGVAEQVLLQEVE
jgi:hypothetical protein